MTLKKSILSLALTLFGTAAFAQTGVVTGTPFGSGEDSIRCRQNLSMLSMYAKSGSFQDAYEPWTKAYAECPGSSKNIYIFGARILRWQIEQEKDTTKRLELIKKLEEMYDMRLKYFGDDEKFGADQIVAAKITDYLNLAGEAADYSRIYGWAKAVVETNGAMTNPQLLYFFVFGSRAVAQADHSKAENYINDYLKASEYIDAQLSKVKDNEEAVKAIEMVKTPMDADFASSGLAGCDVLEKVYTVAKVEENKKNKAYLNQVSVLFGQAGCDEAESYFLASRYLFELEPSAKAAMGLAGKAVQDKNYAQANEYLQKAISLSDSNSDKVKCYELMASLAMRQGNYGAARAASNNALAINPKSGKSLLLIAQMIGSSADNLFPNDRVKQRAVYYLVIDKLQAAAAGDPSVAGEAGRLIARYRGLLPSAQDIFMHPELKQGQSFTVPGYGTTTIR